MIGFLCFTLLLTRYSPPPLNRPGPWPVGTWPPLTVIVAAWNEEDAIDLTLDQSRGPYPGALEVVLADNNSTDRTAERAQAAAERLGLDYRRCFEPEAGKHHALNTALAEVTTPLVVTIDADTLPHPRALTYLIRARRAAPRTSTCAPAPAR